MSRRAGNVRLSIVVPHLGADGPFEDTLISILENRPAGVEVIVAHDGSYSDPFELSDEVRFVVGSSHSLPGLMASAAEEACGQYVHVIANGVRATNGWTEPSLAKLDEEDVGLVAPLAISRNDDSIVSAGWTTSSLSVTNALGFGRTQLGRRDHLRLQGVCLAASFWRRSLLVETAAAFKTSNSAAAQFAWSRLISDQGWKIRLADDSIVLAEAEMLGLAASFAKARSERELQRSMFRYGLLSSTVKASLATATTLLKPGRWGDSAGQLIGTLLPRKQVFNASLISEPCQETARTLRMPLSHPEIRSESRAA